MSWSSRLTDKGISVYSHLIAPIDHLTVPDTAPWYGVRPSKNVLAN